MCPNRKEAIPNLINPVTNERRRCPVCNNIHRIDEICLNDMEVKYVLLSLDPGKATGPDGI